MIAHKPVLLEEVIALLEPKSNQSFIDATVGQGGHAHEILSHTHPDGRLLGIDRDAPNLNIAKKRLKPFGARAVLVQDSYANVSTHAYAHKFSQVDAILVDLGFSSAHIDDPKRGFSFQQEGPLDMRYDTRQKLTAAEIVNTWDEDELARVFRKLGEETYARQIAKAIVKARVLGDFQTTTQLAELIVKNKRRGGKIHPATQVFQALRMTVNRELEELEKALPEFVSLLRPGGRLAVISFHSLEDRIIKQFFADKQKNKEIKIQTKRPITATLSEIKSNPRARSAKLRVAETV
ncbi:16S rRNA (cytosine(1402)-N(4))-methyltransferase RsmH [Patescibacteria group bacterium]|nr:16S rRNA (cytosine(1402)-N(4))-methyltransferase RsmH [Patescibacteria group bacterium]MBU1705658.1 16S rRNA (cytosine(1402)-N(4))-methyltransferase RsmH [Patescibacteria group bacterium]